MGVLSNALLPGPREPTTLAQTSKNLAVVKKIVKLSPERTDMWAKRSSFDENTWYVERGNIMVARLQIIWSKTKLLR